jgi:integrase
MDGYTVDGRMLRLRPLRRACAGMPAPRVARCGAWYHALCVFALTTGMQIGELLALRWRDVNLGATLTVNGTVVRTLDDGLAMQELTTQTARRHVRQFNRREHLPVPLRELGQLCMGEDRPAQRRL